MPKEYERFEAPQPVWVQHGSSEWCSGRSLGRLRSPGKKWNEYEVEYVTASGETEHRSVPNHRVSVRRPIAEPEKNAPCAQCGTSREDCNRRGQAEWPPYCCPRCWRAKEKYALHVRFQRAG